MPTPKTSKEYISALWSEVSGAFKIGVYDKQWSAHLYKALNEIPYEGRDKADILKRTYEYIKLRLNHTGSGNPE
jgi:hypothetical protein